MPNNPIFSDIEKHWAQACICQLAERKLISGYPDGSFRPDTPVTRAEFAALVIKVFPDAAPVRSAIAFTDVSVSYWAHQVIQAAYRAGFVSGYPDQTFKPGEPISKVQVLVSLVSGLKYGYSSTTMPNEILPRYFEDAEQIPKYAVSAIAAATEKNLVVNYPDVRQLKPNQTATRGEVAALICQALIQPWQVSAIPQYVVGTPISRPRQFTSGTVTAEVYHRLEKDGLTYLRLKITRQGKTLRDDIVPTPPQKGMIERAVGLLVQDLDKDGEPEVLVDLFQPDKGNFVSLIYYYQKQQNQYAYIEQNWGDAGYRLQDLNRDSQLEFISSNYQFKRFTQNSLDSALPIAIWQYQQGSFVNVTRLYKDQIRGHAYQLWQETVNRRQKQQPIKAIWAAYLADKYLLDEGRAGWQFVRQVYQASDAQEFFNALVDTLATNKYFSVEFLLKPQFDQVDNFSEGLARVSIDSKWGYVDNTGKIVVQPQFVGVASFRKYLTPQLIQEITPQSTQDIAKNSPLLAWVRADNKYGYIDQTGKFIIQPQFEATGSRFSEGLLAVEISSNWGYINTTGKVIIYPQFNGVDSFSEGLARVWIGEKYGYIDKTGKVIIPLKFDGADSFSGGIARIWTGEKFGYIDTTGKLVIQPQFDYADSFREGIARVLVGNKWGYIDKTGKFIIQLQFDYANAFSAGLAGVRIGNKWGYIDKIGKIVIQPQFDGVDDFREQLARVKIGNKLSYINKKGTLVIKLPFDDIDYFFEGLARVKIANKYGYIDQTGKVVISPKFEQADSFKDELAAVKIGKKYGYIYKTGNFVIEPQFEAANSFYEGLAKVRLNGKWSYIFHPLK